MAPRGDGETLFESLKVPCFILSYSVLCLSFYFTPSHSYTHTHSVTSPLHKSACHGGDIACMQSRFIKRMALFSFLFFTLSSHQPWLPHLSVMAAFAYDMPLSGTLHIWGVVLITLSHWQWQKSVFRQLLVTTVKSITGDKWGYYPCCHAGRSQDTRQLQV